MRTCELSLLPIFAVARKRNSLERMEARAAQSAMVPRGVGTGEVSALNEDAPKDAPAVTSSEPIASEPTDSKRPWPYG